MAGYSAYTDQELVALLKARDYSAFAEIYGRYSMKLFDQASRLLRDEDAARDLVQELFITIWNKADHIKADANVAGYLYVAAQNSALKLMRKGRLHIDYLSSLAEFEEQVTEEHGESFDVEKLYRLIEIEIAKLPEKMRVVFELSRRGDLSYRDIALQLDVAENTVRKQVSNALKVIRTNVSKHGSTGLIVLALLRTS